MELLPRKEEILNMIYSWCKREDECLVWTRSKNRGYGCVKIDGKQWSVPRLVLILESGSEGECVLHAPRICHNRACCEISHLRWGSRKENSQDMILDGESRFGEKQHLHKLTEQQIRDIRAEIDITQSKLAEKYGVSRPLIGMIRRGRIWKHVD